jgi:hypothetical protein
MTDPPNEFLVPATTAAAEFGFGRRTIGRRMADPTSGFPTPIRIKGRLYFRRCDLESYKSALIHEALGAAQKSLPNATARE